MYVFIKYFIKIKSKTKVTGFCIDMKRAKIYSFPSFIIGQAITDEIIETMITSMIDLFLLSLELLEHLCKLSNAIINTVYDLFNVVQINT